MNHEEENEDNKTPRFINRTENTCIPSALIFAPIFTSKPRGTFSKAESRETIELLSNRTKTEVLTYKGPRLDVTLDFQLFCMIVSKSIQASTTKIQLSYREVFFYSKRKSSRKAKQDIKLRIEKFMDCRFEINRYKCEKHLSPPLREIKASLVSRIDFDPKQEVFNINVCEDFLLEEQAMSPKIQNLKRDIIKLDYLHDIPTDAAKSLFLYIESKWYTEKMSVTFLHKDMVNRIGSTSTSQREMNRQIKNALVILKEILYLMNFEYKLDRVTGERLVEVFPVKLNERFPTEGCKFENKRVKALSTAASKVERYQPIKSRGDKIITS